jgi:4-aminobutyrate aminotransferase
MKRPQIKNSLPGPQTKKLIKLDKSFVSPSYTRVYPLVPGITHIPYAYCYRCAYNLTYPKCGLCWVEDTLFRITVPAEEVAAIFVEPIQGEGGYIVPPPGFHKELNKIAKKYSILYVADEVQSGMGRNGKMFAMEHFGVKAEKKEGEKLGR